jgi:hypothetical protein
MNEDVIREFMVSIGYKTDETSLKKFTASLASVTKMVMGLGAAIVATAGAVVAGVKIISGEMERLYYASQRTGETVGNLMALRYAAGQIGLTADQAQTSLEGFTRTLRLNPGMNGLLQQLGVTGNGPLEQFQGFVGKMKQMQPYIAAQYAGLFGIDPDTLLMLENGLPKIQAAQDRYRANLGAFGINPEQAAQAGTDFDNSIRDLLSDVHLFWVLLQEHLAPVLQTIVAQFERWEAGNADKVAQKIATALEAVAKWVSEINWDEVGKDVDVFLSKAWEVAKVIGNIAGGIAKIASVFGGSSTATPADGYHTGDSPFIAWIRKKRQAAERLFGGSQAGQAGESFGAVIELPPTSSSPRGIRNNNPGNIRSGSFANSAGAIGADDKGFAIFADMQTGMQATMALLRSYAARGFDTIRKVISRWAPGNENNTQAYIADVAKKLGLSPDQVLNGSQLGSLSQAIFAHENGSAYGKLGVGSASAAGGSVTIQQKTDIHVHGSPDPHGTARTVLGEQGRVNGDMVRNFAGAVQ